MRKELLRSMRSQQICFEISGLIASYRKKRLFIQKELGIDILNPPLTYEQIDDYLKDYEEQIKEQKRQDPELKLSTVRF